MKKFDFIPLSNLQCEKRLNLENLFLTISLFTLIAGIIGNAFYAANVLGFLSTTQAEREIVDKVLYLFIPLYVFFLTLACFRNRTTPHFYESSSVQGKLFSVLIVSILSLAVPTNLFTEDHSHQWLGFGLKTAVVFIAAWYLLGDSILEIDRMGGGKVIYWGAYSIALVLVFQPPWGFSDSFHSLYVLNDLMSPAFGGDNYVSQYSGIQGILLSGLLKNSAFTIQAGAFSLSAFAAIALLAYAFAVRQILDKKYSLGATLIAFAFLLSSTQETQLGSILYSASVLGIRMFFPMLAFMFLALFIGSFSTKPRVAYLLFAGLFAGLGVLNNLEFGLATVISIVAVFSTKALSIKHLFIFFIGTVSGSLLGTALMLLAGIDLASRINFITTFASGFGGSPFPIAGFHLFLFPFFAVSALLLLAIGLDKEQLQTVRLKASLGLTMAVFGYLSLGYFVTVSSPSVQLQASFFALGLTGASLINLKPHVKDSLSRIMAILTKGLLSLGLAISLTAMPSLQDELVRISPNDRLEFETNFSNAYLEETISQIARFDDSVKSEMALYLVWGNIISGMTGIPSVAAVTDARDEVTFGFLQSCSKFSQFKYILAVRDYDGLPNSILQNCGFSREVSLSAGWGETESKRPSWVNDVWVNHD